MRVVREAGNHVHALRSTHAVQRELEAREPALINLPIALPSIPIVNPILTQLIAGPQTTTTAQAPASTNTGSSGGSSDSGSGGGSSGGNSGGSSGSSSGSGSSDGSSNGGSSGSSGSSGGSTNTSSGGSGENGSSQGNTNGGSNSSSGSSAGGSSSGGSNGDGNAQAGGSGTGDSGTSNGGDTDASAPASSGTAGGQVGASSGSGNASSTTTPGVVNVSSGNTGNTAAGTGDNQKGDSSDANSSGSGSTGSHAGGTSTSTVGSKGSSTAVDGSGNTGGDGGAGTSDTSGSISGSSGHKGLSSGAIAGIVSALLVVLLILLLVLLRRRSMARRSERRNRWWQRRNASSPTPAQATAGSGTVSARSSFATTFDHGLSPHLTLNFDSSVIPEVPPMAEIRNSPNTNSPLTARGPVSLRPLLINVESERRASVYSAHSDNSEQDAQYLVIHPSTTAARPGINLLTPDMPTPMSVRPFSPSESFAFPKPPGKRSSEWSKRESQNDLSSRRTSVKSSKSIARKPVPAIDNPFADPVAEKRDQGAAKAEFAEVELIQRPFIPTLGDELAVNPGDRVRIVQPFDDGWAFVEKIVGESQTQSGLIPIDCLRAENQDLPTFLAAKRVSSYSNAYLAI